MAEKHTADPAEIMRATGHPELEYAAGWTIAGLVTIGTIVAAWVFAQGKSGPGGKYWTSSCMYLPEGRVMPAYSTWQPVVGSSHPTDNPAQSARRR